MFHKAFFLTFEKILLTAEDRKNLSKKCILSKE